MTIERERAVGNAVEHIGGERLCALGVTVEDMWARARRIQATEPLGSDGTTIELLGALGAKYERPCDTGPCGAPACGGGGCAYE